ncbi:NAD(P)/FAD-dependent oxidoreductase [Castellaniella sp.]|uniref:NAD(P)/FAD-dependent oxidoreductase n=1 Tax=Castellaniella sp. TaxID=1955812 RepID=UPI002B003A44|nr:FAD-dependent oxidoreductase [Castellaniella sp.]
MKVAVIGSGISGLAAAHRLHGQAQVTLYEAGSYFGGHTHTVDVSLPDARGRIVTHGVDTGFLVFNERTYPGLIALLDKLKVPTAPSDMSFSVQVPGAGALGAGALEWSGSSLTTVFAQRRNLLRPRFLGMLSELLRFNRLCTALADSGQEQALAQSLGDFLDQHGFSTAFRHWYFLPMLGCIWSCPTDQMLRFPVATMVRFCHNHGLIQVRNRPQWHTVAGGARHYVNAILQGLDARLSTPVTHIERNTAGVLVHTGGATEHFDAVVLAVHSDQALRLLQRPSTVEQRVLGAIRYQSNRAVLHTDTRVMPQRRAAWAAWNYERAADDAQELARVCLHYWINRLQPLPFAEPVLVSLNPVSPIDPQKILGEFDYDHPVFDLQAWSAQSQIPRIQGVRRTWFAGAWTGYGFHEDGLQSGYRAADALLAQMRYREAA